MGSTLQLSTNINTMKNRDGQQISAQVSKMGTITLAEDFILDGYPFQLKNDRDTAVTLKVLPYGNYDRENPSNNQWVETSFAPGWNPEILVGIKATSQNVSLKWGY